MLFQVIFLVVAFSLFFGVIFYNDFKLLREGESIKIPENAYNIHAREYDKDATDYGSRGVYLETNDGFITKDIYTPSEMKNVTAIYLELKSKDGWYKRVDIKEIVSFDIFNMYSAEAIERLKNDFDIGTFWTIKIQTASKSYKLINIIDVSDYDYTKEYVLNDYLSEVAKCNNMAEVSCMWALKKQVIDSRYKG